MPSPSPLRLLRHCPSRRAFSTTPSRPATPLYMLSALSHARETQHYASRSGLGVTAHAPHLEAIRSSEVDVYPSAPGSTVVKSKIPGLVGKKIDVVPVQETAVKQAVSSQATEQEVVAQTQPVQKQEKDKGYQTFTAEGMQIALLVTVVALVGVNAFAFETLGKERQARAVLGQRLGRLEAMLAGGGAAAAAVPAASAPVAAVTSAPAMTTAQAASRDTLVPAVVEKRSTPLSQKVGGWVKAAFWLQ